VARVLFLGSQRRYTGGEAETRVDAADFRALVAELLRRYPAFPAAEFERCTVAIDGELVSSPYLEPLGDETEVRFLHRLAAG
jgi:molybdopterin converting factor small subunit